jgi:hypothetical protein
VHEKSGRLASTEGLEDLIEDGTPAGGALHLRTPLPNPEIVGFGVVQDGQALLGERNASVPWPVVETRRYAI